MISHYQLLTEKLFFENNNLYSDEHLTIYHNQQSLVKSPLTQKPLTIFKTLDSTDFKDVRAFFTTTYPNQLLPIYKGHTFLIANSKEALVGHKVPLVYFKQQAYLLFNDYHYPVVGLLGSSEQTVLDQTILLNDHDLFAKNKPEQLIIDGPQIKQRFSKIYPDIKSYTIDKGLKRRINNDFFNKALVINAYALLILTTVSVAYHYFIVLRLKNTVNYLLGIKPIKILQAKLTVIFKLYLICFITTSSVLVILPTNAQLLTALLKVEVLQLSALLLLYSFLFILEKRRWSRGIFL